MNEENDNGDNTEKRTDETHATSEKATKKTGGHRAVWLAVLFLLIALLGIASAGYLWLELREFRAARAWNSEQVRGLEAHFNELRANTIPRAQLEQRHAAIDAARERLQQRLTSLEKNTARLRELTQGGQQAWHRAQVIYLLQLAQNELSLAGNVDTALAALQAADAQLARWPGADLQAVRAKIRRDITALQALPKPDITGMALTLNALAAQATTLPLQAQSRDNYQATPGAVAETDEGFWQRLWQGLNSSFSNMVNVRRNATPVKPLLTPNQEALVYQHLALQLQTARLALLKGDYKNYRASLVSAQDWLNRWFDTSQSATQAALAEIERLLATSLPVELPALSATGEVLELAANDDSEGQP